MVFSDDQNEMVHTDGNRGGRSSDEERKMKVSDDQRTMVSTYENECG